MSSSSSSLRPKPRANNNHNNNTNMPSFSSTLLDQIYLSTDYSNDHLDNDNNNNNNNNSSSSKHRRPHFNQVADFRRASLVDNWIRKDLDTNHHCKPPPPPPAAVSKSKPPLPPLSHDYRHRDSYYNDLIFFTSSSSSSTSSDTTSSDTTDFFTTNSSSSNPKPIRTTTTTDNIKKMKNNNRVHQHNDDELLIKSKSRALKIYANLKKLKQPISPGGKITNLINSLFTNNAPSKSKNASKTPSSSSACSSASSFSRSCLSKYSPKSREKMRQGIQRTVRFDPVSVIVDQQSKPCGHKSIYNHNQCSDYKTYLHPRMEEVTVHSLKTKNYYNGNGYEDDDDDDDVGSDSSSDLFELDNLSLFGDGRFCELPVYETTYLGKKSGGLY